MRAAQPLARRITRQRSHVDPEPVTRRTTQYVFICVWKWATDRHVAQADFSAAARRRRQRSGAHNTIVEREGDVAILVAELRAERHRGLHGRSVEGQPPHLY